MTDEILFTKQERFRGRWMDMITVKITPERAKIMSMDQLSTGIRYVETKEGAAKVEAVDLQDLNVPQLKKYAKDKGYDIGDARKKAEILEVIAKNTEVV